MVQIKYKVMQKRMEMNTKSWIISHVFNLTDSYKKEK